MHVALVLNGTIQKGFFEEFQRQGFVDYWIAVDGGIRHFSKDFAPDLFMGDMDSCGAIGQEILFGKENKKSSDDSLKEKTIIYSCEKDETDSELAVQKAIAIGANKITILGWNGGRMDHLYGNITLLHYGLKHQVSMVLEDKNNRVFMTKESVLVKKDGFTYLSLFSVDEEVKGLTLRNVKYEVTDFTLFKEMVRGISNEVTGEEAEISFEKGKLLVMQSN